MENNDLNNKLIDLDKRTARIGEEVRTIAVQVREAHRGYVEVYAEMKGIEKEQGRTIDRLNRMEEQIDERLSKVEQNTLSILDKLITSNRWSFGLILTGLAIIISIAGLIFKGGI